MTEPHRLRVIKVGGSLFDLPALPSVLQQWLQAQPSAFQVLIAGGGKLADVIRSIEQQHTLPEQAGHWLCIGLMNVSAQLLASLLPESELILEYGHLCEEVQKDRPAPLVFGVERFLQAEEPLLPGERLTHGWETTSDSIAARVAQVLGADELILCKSANLPVDISWHRAADLGLVDQRFPYMVDGLAVKWCNLRQQR